MHCGRWDESLLEIQPRIAKYLGPFACDHTTEVIRFVKHLIEIKANALNSTEFSGDFPPGKALCAKYEWGNLCRENSHEPRGKGE